MAGRPAKRRHKSKLVGRRQAETQRDVMTNARSQLTQEEARDRQDRNTLGHRHHYSALDIVVYGERLLL